MADTRLALSFDILGLPAREAILLKSFIRLLDNRTNQHWVYRSSPESQAPVLTFLAEDDELADMAVHSTAPDKKLRMGVMEIGVVASLSRPLRTDDLELQLNRLGDLVQQARTGIETMMPTVTGFGDLQPLPELRTAPKPPKLPKLPTWEHAPAPKQAMALASMMSLPLDPMKTTPMRVEVAKPVLAELNTPAVTAVAAPEPAPKPAPAYAHPPAAELFRLLRWPHTSLLRTPEQSKLASYMLGMPISVQTLHMRSRQPVHVCLEFINELRRMGFVSSVSRTETVDPMFGAAAPAKPAVPKPMPSNEPSQARMAKDTAVSLFSRIRKRLGIQTPVAH